MKFYFRNRSVDVDLQTIFVALLVLGWSLFYYFSILSQPEGKESVLFIKPLTVSLVICFFFVIWGAVKIDHKKESQVKSVDLTKSEDIGFLDHRRLFFVGSMIVYAAALNFFGFMIPSFVFLFVVFYYLGVRKPWVLIVVPIGLPILLSVVFVSFMKVPLSLWPNWFLK